MNTVPTRTVIDHHLLNMLFWHGMAEDNVMQVTVVVKQMRRVGCEIPLLPDSSYGDESRDENKKALGFAIPEPSTTSEPSCGEGAGSENQRK